MGKKCHKVPPSALPTAKTNPKIPSRLQGVVSTNLAGPVSQRKPAWGLTLVDHQHHPDWGSWPTDPDSMLRILGFLCEMERLSWGDIWGQMAGGERRRGQKHKLIPVTSLINSAQARLLALDLDEQEDLFRFRLGGTERLWGVFVGDHHVFYPVWWDADHKICPSAER